MAGNLTIPNVFAGLGGQQLASLLDQDFNAIRDYVNPREVTVGTLAARPVAGVSGRWYFATDDAGGTLWVDTGSAWVLVGRSSPPTGYVLMRRIGTNTWTVTAPDGSAVSTAGSTTSGLQEAINYAAQNGHSLWVTGGSVVPGPPAQDRAVITCTTGITWPPMQGKHIRFDWCTVNFTSAVTGDGMTFDSCMMVSVDFHGQIVYQGNGAAVRFKPTNPVPLDATTQIVDSVFRILTIATIGGTNPTGVVFDSSLAPIVNSRFEFVEINGANGPTTYGQHGIEITSSTTGFFGNIISCPHLHRFAGVSVRLGTSTTGAQNVHSNHCDLVVLPNGAASTAVQVYGKYNRIRCAILNNEGTVNEGIKLEASAEKNVFIVARNLATTPVNDISTTKDNEGVWGSIRPRASVHRNGANQTGVPSGTQTKVLFTTKVFDTGGAFDTSISRWTPGRPGRARISAAVAWAGMASGVFFAVSIWKNGAIYKEVGKVSASTAVDQAAHIDALVDVNSSTDYFEIFARQNSGANLDISGSSVVTWAMFEMVD